MNSKNYPKLLFPILVSIILILRLFFPERGLDDVGVSAIWDAVFATLLLVIFILLSLALGSKILDWLKVQLTTMGEKGVISFGVGSGVIAYVIVFLTTVGLLSTWTFVFILVGLSLIFYQRIHRILIRIYHSIAHSQRRWSKLDLLERLIIVLAFGIFFACFLAALSPPNDYDGLMYHLPGPLAFIQAGGFTLLPEMMQANSPFLGEMLFLLGLVFGSDVFAQLVHLTYTVFLVLAIFFAGRRFGDQRLGFFASAIFLGIPIIAIWSNWAYIDLIWTFYEFLAFVLLMYWYENRNWRILALAGVMMGFGISSKYYGLLGFGISLAWIIVQVRRLGLKEIFRSLLIFGGMALVNSSFWFLKNLVLSGNPVYPLIWGGPGYTSLRVDLLQYYMDSFGMGKSLLDLLLVVPRLYIIPEPFTTFSIEIPSLLFPLALIYIFLPKKPWLNACAFFVLLRVIMWFFGSQQTRFLLPIFPELSLLTAYVLTKIVNQISSLRIKRILPTVLLTSFLVVSLVYLLINLIQTPSLSVIFGYLSEAQYLDTWSGNFKVSGFINESLPNDALVLMIGNGMTYYCGLQCLPDTDKALWPEIVFSNEKQVNDVINELSQRGITHLLYSYYAEESIRKNDPDGIYEASYEFFRQSFIPTCSNLIYQDAVHELYTISCPKSDS